jgi:hypothetical protein
MLEYPLWYAYFPGIAALGVSATPALQVGDRSRGRLLLVPMMHPGCMTTANVYQAYRTLRSLHRIQPHPSGAAAEESGEKHGGGSSGAATAFSVHFLHGIGAVASNGA